MSGSNHITGHITRPGRKQVLALALAVITLYIVIPQLGSFKHSLSLLPNADLSDLLLAALLTGLSYAAAAGTYCLLALKPIPYLRTLLIQIAGMFVNRLLPAGIGGMGVNYVYLRKNHHEAAEAASVVAANNTLGIIGNSVLIGVLLVLFNGQLPPSLKVWNALDIKIIVVIAIAVVIVWLVLYRYFGQRLIRALRDFLHQFLDYRKRPRQVGAALVCSLILTICNVASLWLCVQAMHIGLSFVQVLLVFSFGVALGSATPTPGGLGGVEAGMVAGLILYGADHAPALAAVLIYRLISYWLPLILGAGAFAYSDRQSYL